MWTTRCPTAADTFRLGEALGRRAMAGTVVSLHGDLGAGKTVFAKGVGAGLGVTTRVQSPTFVIVQTHEGGRLPLWHADLYRLRDASEIDALGLGDAPGVLLVEWGDRFPDQLPADRLDIRFDEEPDGARVLYVHPTGPRHAALDLS